MPSFEDMREDRDLQLTNDLDESIRKIQNEFNGDETLKTRVIESQKNPGIRCCIFYTDSMITNQLINDYIVKPINLLDMPMATSCVIDILMTKVIQINEIKKTTDFKEIVESIVYGDTVLLANGCKEALLLNTKGFPTRAIQEPEGEKVLFGPREGFNEALLLNLTMLRRRIKTRDLKMQYLSFGRQTKTKACVCYIGGIAKQEIVDELLRRLEKFDLDSALDANYIAEYIKDEPFSLFRTIGMTERPDIVAAKLLEGRVALFLDNTPQVITAPYLFVENFQSNEDYYVDFWYASVFRVLRILGFFLAICAPAFYVAAVTNQQEILPTPLMLSICIARQGVPFPTLVETLLMLFMFNILKEAGIRMSSNIGQALSIVGALVIGQAAVEAKIVSAPVIIVIAIAGITSLIIPKLSIAVILLQVVYLLMASVIGLYGLVFGIIVLMVYIIDLRTFGIRSLFDMEFRPQYSIQYNKDILIRAPWPLMKLRPFQLSSDEVRSKKSKK